MVKTLPSNSGSEGLIPGPGNKIPYAVGYSQKCGGFPGGSVVKNLLASAGDKGEMSLIPGWEDQGGHDNPLRYSHLENPMDTGSWQAIAHRVTKSRTQLKPLSTYACKEEERIKDELRSLTRLHG